MKALNGRLIELSRIAERPCELVYADTGFIKPNRWLSRDLILDFESRGLIQREGKFAKVTPKGLRLLTNGEGK